MIDLAENRPTLELAPEWYAGDLMPESYPVSIELRRRLRDWNRMWETVLDPVFRIRWPDRETGRIWSAEGRALVDELQKELGSAVRVIVGFSAYDPDSPDYEGE